MFYELETWRPQPGREAEHIVLLRVWFAYVRAHHAELFPEWRSAQLFQEVQGEADAVTGQFAMLFGYADQAGFLAYKARRRDWSGPYAEYKQIDPYPVFIPESVTTTHWRPHLAERWLTQGPATAASFFEVVDWAPRVEPGPATRPWFTFAAAARAGRFPEWRSARCWRAVERETGRPRDRYLTIVEYGDRGRRRAASERRPPDLEAARGDDIDLAVKTQVFWQPAELDRWLAW